MGKGYHSAHLVELDITQDDSLLVESLQHLAIATITNKQTITQLVEANTKVTENIGKLTDKLV